METLTAQATYQSIRASEDVCYFLIKSYQTDNIHISQQCGLWATTSRNERMIRNAFQAHRFVVLVFSANASGKFCGYAVVASEPSMQEAFVGGDGRAFPGKAFRVHWVSTREIPFQHFEHITNSLNESKAVKIGRDGQPLALECGRQILDVYDSFQQALGESPPGGWMLAAPRPPAAPPAASSSAPAPPAATVDWDETVLALNPLLSLYPIDLTKFNYDGYLDVYHSSEDFLRRRPTELPPLANVTDWSAAAPARFAHQLRAALAEIEGTKN